VRRIVGYIDGDRRRIGGYPRPIRGGEGEDVRRRSAVVCRSRAKIIGVMGYACRTVVARNGQIAVRAVK